MSFRISQANPPAQVYPEIFYNRKISPQALLLWSAVNILANENKMEIRKRLGFSPSKWKSLWEELVEEGYAGQDGKVVYQKKYGGRDFDLELPEWKKPKLDSGCEQVNTVVCCEKKKFDQKEKYNFFQFMYHELPNKEKGIYKYIPKKKKGESPPTTKEKQYEKEFQKATKTMIRRCIHLSYLFTTKQRQHHPNYIKEITYERIMEGAVVIHKLIRLDGYEYEEVKMTLRWLTESPGSFWSRNVLSLKNLRKRCSDDITKFDHLRMDRDADLNRSNASTKLQKEEPINRFVKRKSEELRKELQKLTGSSEDPTMIVNLIYKFFRSLPDGAKKKFDPEGGFVGFFDRYLKYIKQRYGDWDGVTLKMLAPPESLCWNKFIHKIQDKYRVSFKTGRNR